MKELASQRPVLILSNPTDSTAALVRAALTARSTPVVQVDTADFPQRATLTATFDGTWSGELRALDDLVPLEEVRSIYYRRPGSFIFPPEMNDTDRSFATEEARAGLLGVLASLSCGWVNHPAHAASASYKPTQLGLAATFGLNPPQTIITNNVERVRQFAHDLASPIVYKSLTGGVLDGETSLGVSTRLVDTGELDDSIGLTAHLFQEFIQKVHDVRLTVAGVQMFAVEIHPRSSTYVDWRADLSQLEYRAVEIPPAIRAGISSLMRALGLAAGTIDFAISPTGQWRFLEINPNGQWKWIAREADLPIAEAVADILAEPNWLEPGLTPHAYSQRRQT